MEPKRLTSVRWQRFITQIAAHMRKLDITAATMAQACAEEDVTEEEVNELIHGRTFLNPDKRNAIAGSLGVHNPYAQKRASQPTYTPLPCPP